MPCNRNIVARVIKAQKDFDDKKISKKKLREIQLKIYNDIYVTK